MYGDLQDGSHSDGKVTNQSSLSLKSLLNGYVNSYRTFKVEGNMVNIVHYMIIK